ncbi:MAG TPA: peptide chain release factor N(5)-glutamine methyltransferase [Hyphomicrobiaceae bacterium]|nr:peptide chain release factor N(5)-glutamine methyltransferase [Hyphomicrobiaceae bacterium]
MAGAVRQAAVELQGAGIHDVGTDARRLVGAALGLSAAELLSRPERPLSAAEAERLRCYVDRRRRREPVSRILGARDFYGRSFAISPATLDPRPDSETLIAAVLELVRSEGRTSAPLRLLDVGTGSGCLLLTLLCELPLATGVGTDINQSALQVARANACRLGVAERAAWLVADALDGIAGNFDILVANPPYVRSGEIAALEPEVRDFDPVAALDGGADGLNLYRRIAAGIRTVVADGWVVLEVGHDQADAAAELLASNPRAIDRGELRFYRDVTGRRRCVAVRTQS